jgi:O-antigen/teichoic acid export membrane protein
MQNINQLVLTVCLVSAALISPTAEGQVVGRIIYSITTLTAISFVYQRTRGDGPVPYPPLKAVLRRAINVSYRPYWRYGLESALDKNLATLFTHIPLQLVGIIAGPASASYIQLGLRGIQRTSFFTSAVYENIQAVVPQAVGRHDYARLWKNFLRVLGVLALGGLAFYVLVVLIAPLLLVPIFGAEWEPILPLLPAFAVYGLATTVGGIFGPLYRVFNLMRAALLTKMITLVVMIPVGVWLIQQAGALGGVWMLTGMFVISVLLTAAFTLPVLRQHAHE